MGRSEVTELVSWTKFNWIPVIYTKNECGMDITKNADLTLEETEKNCGITCIIRSKPRIFALPFRNPSLYRGRVLQRDRSLNCQPCSRRKWARWSRLQASPVLLQRWPFRSPILSSLFRLFFYFCRSTFCYILLFFGLCCSSSRYSANVQAAFCCFLLAVIDCSAISHFFHANIVLCWSYLNFFGQ